jgi:hypothetical protein
VPTRPFWPVGTRPAPEPEARLPPPSGRLPDLFAEDGDQDLVVGWLEEEAHVRQGEGLPEPAVLRIDRGMEDDGNAAATRMGANHAADVEAVLAAQAEVGEDDVGEEAVESGEKLLRAGDESDRKPCLGEDVAKQAAEVGVILDDQKPGCRALCHSSPEPAPFKLGWEVADVTLLTVICT